MKTTFKTMTSQKIAAAKRAEFQEKTGLKWDYYHTGNGMRFTPVVTKYTPIDPQKAALLLPYLLTEYVEFISLQKMSGMLLADVLVAAKTLTKARQAFCTVNRAGGVFAIRKTHLWESEAK